MIFFKKTSEERKAENEKQKTKSRAKSRKQKTIKTN